MSTFAERAERARVLADRYPASNEILTFYAGIAGWQNKVSGSLSSFDDLAHALPSLITLVSETGPPELVDTGKSIDTAKFDQFLLEHWEFPGEFSILEFFARTLMQIYATQLPDGLDCPWCNQSPQVGCLRSLGDGQALDLVCALCCRRHAFIRGKCPACEETEQSKLVTFTTPEFEQLRVKACDSCRGYFLVVDLEKDPRAIPEVDEMVGIPLDLWAVDAGYMKLRANIVGI